eukprot:TRINITY_DN78035_c0_g1_i1.p1 TRINITY_DN78035_c0_g1~~TRINITY_DN78035_c0_g1_i1.p1  ORF type:complete len:479 (-),score=82.56 TRINITY_DN78035_c0_g1_i1:57-1493(-)
MAAIAHALNRFACGGSLAIAFVRFELCGGSHSGGERVDKADACSGLRDRRGGISVVVGAWLASQLLMNTAAAEPASAVPAGGLAPATQDYSTNQACVCDDVVAVAVVTALAVFLVMLFAGICGFAWLKQDLDKCQSLNRELTARLVEASRECAGCGQAATEREQQHITNDEGVKRAEPVDVETALAHSEANRRQYQEQVVANLRLQAQLEELAARQEASNRKWSEGQQQLEICSDSLRKREEELRRLREESSNCARRESELVAQLEERQLLADRERRLERETREALQRCGELAARNAELEPLEVPLARLRHECQGSGFEARRLLHRLQNGLRLGAVNTAFMFFSQADRWGAGRLEPDVAQVFLGDLLASLWPHLPPFSSELALSGFGAVVGRGDRDPGSCRGTYTCRGDTALSDKIKWCSGGLTLHQVPVLVDAILVEEFRFLQSFDSVLGKAALKVASDDDAGSISSFEDVFALVSI